VRLQAFLVLQSPYGNLWKLNVTYGYLFEQNIWIIQEKVVTLQYETNSKNLWSYGAGAGVFPCHLAPLSMEETKGSPDG
jgi:hypothetical protein